MYTKRDQGGALPRNLLTLKETQWGGGALPGDVTFFQGSSKNWFQLIFNTEAWENRALNKKLLDST